MENWQIFRQKLFSLLAELSSQLKPVDIKNVEALLNEGEELIALEVLCDQILEWDSVCTPEQVRQIAALGKEVNLEETYVRALLESQ